MSDTESLTETETYVPEDVGSYRAQSPEHDDLSEVLPSDPEDVGSYRAQSPEHDDLSEVGSVATNPAPSLAPSQPEKDLSLPVKGMYPLLDLITEQGSSGLGKYPFSHRLDQRPEHFSRQDCHCPRSSPRIYQRAFPGCLFFHHKSQFQNTGRPCSQAARDLWFKRRDREVPFGNKIRR
jgi:hypothetical protein